MTADAGRVYIGITGEQLLVNKKFAELLQPYDNRAAAAADYVRRVRPDVAVQTGVLTDPMVSVRTALASAISCCSSCHVPVPYSIGCPSVSRFCCRPLHDCAPAYSAPR